LRDFYGLLPQPPSDPFQFFLWEILSTAALPARRDLAWHALRRIPALTPDALFRTPAKELTETLGVIGPHRDDRLERIRHTTGEFKRQRDALDEERLRRGGLSTAHRVFRRLTHLPQETRDYALLYVAGYAVLPLDDSCARVVTRLDGPAMPSSAGGQGFVLERTRGTRELRQQRRRARRVLAAALPRRVDVFREAVLYLRHHAEHTCTAVAPHCSVCPLSRECAFNIRVSSHHAHDADRRR
jgi:endonuclease III